MLALACGYEQLGAYERAKDILERLVTAHPETSEAWLRLAMSAGRLGARLQSRDHLEKVISLNGAEWIRSLAYEELARIHLLLDQAPKSIELLEQIQNPSAGTLVLTAYLYDRLGSPQRSLDLLNRVEAGASKGPTPRKRYDGWPAQALDETRQDLREAAAIRLSRLRALVSGGEAS